MGIIICAFPATGKTTAIANADDLGISACDSDSEGYHWVDCTLPSGERKERSDWPRCYMDHLLAMSLEYDLVFCSTHQEVRDALVAAGMYFVVVYPTSDQKSGYLDRVMNRHTGLHGTWGHALMSKNWEAWLDGMRAQTGCAHIVLQAGQYLSDVLDQIRAL